MRALTCLLLFLVSSNVFAEEKSLYAKSMEYVEKLDSEPETIPVYHFKWADDDKKVTDGNFWLMAGGLTISTVYDAETTFHGIRYSPGFHEKNPSMKPFVAHGRAATYAVQASANIGVMYVAYKFKKSRYRQLGKCWWAMPVVWIVGHTYYGTRNLMIAH